MRKFEDITTGYIFTYNQLKEHLEMMTGGPLTNDFVDGWIAENNWKCGGNVKEVEV